MIDRRPFHRAVFAPTPACRSTQAAAAGTPVAYAASGTEVVESAPLSSVRGETGTSLDDVRIGYAGGAGRALVATREAGRV